MAAHDCAMVEGWNNAVKGKDVVVVLGDVFWVWNNETKNLWNNVLKGNKILVKGNHDHWLKKAKYPFRRIWNKSFKDEEGKFYRHVVGCHYPLLTWNRKRYGAIHVHGHCHGNILPYGGRLDVGVDVAKIMFNEYRPFSFEEVDYLIKGHYEENGNE